MADASKFSALTTQQKADTRDAIRGYKVYTALITQTGENAPVATVLENTIGNLIWTRSSAGSYDLTLVGAFPSDDKLFSIITSGMVLHMNLYVVLTRNGPDSITIQSKAIIIDFAGEEVSDIPLDDYLLNFPFEIRIYP